MNKEKTTDQIFKMRNRPGSASTLPANTYVVLDPNGGIILVPASDYSFQLFVSRFGRENAEVHPKEDIINSLREYYGLN